MLITKSSLRKNANISA